MAKKEKEEVGIYELFLELVDWSVEFEQRLAAFVTLNAALQSFRDAQQVKKKGGTTPPIKAMPNLSMRASPDGVKAIECSLSLALLDEQHVEPVLIGLISMEHRRMRESVDQIGTRFASFIEYFTPREGATS